MSRFPIDSSSTSESVITEAFIPGQTFQIQKYQNYVGECLKEASGRHVIVQICQPGAWAERRGANGGWIRYLKERGTLTIVPAGPVPDIRLLTSSSMIACAIEKNFAHEVALEMDRQPAEPVDFHSGVHDAAIEGLMNLMIRDFEIEQQPYALYSETLAHALAMRLLLHNDRSVEAKNSSATPLPARILCKVQDRIEAELDTKLSLASLAKESGYSRAHFLRMFRAATGVTPHKYVLDRRLSSAQHLLRQSKMSLVDIASKCGFSSQTYMNDVFRKQLGVTPQKYRRNI